MTFAASASLALSAALGLAGSAAAAALPDHPSKIVPARSWLAQLVHPAPASCSHGQKLITPTGDWTDALGVAHVTYKADPGLVTMVPPRGLTANRVTTALLADIGLGAREQANPGLQHRLVRQALNLAHIQHAPQFCFSRARDGVAKPAGRPSGRASGTGPQLGVYYGGNWAGYAILESQYGNGISTAVGSYHVPKSMTSSAPSAEATWVGIGGKIAGEGNNWGLIQVGSEMQTNDGYRSVWEYIGSSGCTGFCGAYSGVNAIHYGDSVNALVAWDTTTSACFVFTDYSRSTASFDVCNHTVNIPYDHTSAEWINEFPNFKYYDSPGTVNWTGQQVSTGGGFFDSPFSYPHNAYISGTSNNGPPSCSTTGVLSIPENSKTVTGAGTSDTITCSIHGVDSP